MRAEKSQRRGEQQSVPMVVWYVWYVFYRLMIQNNQNNLKLCNTTTGKKKRAALHHEPWMNALTLPEKST